MTAKEYLSQTWRINRMIDAKLEQVRELRELAVKATSTLSDAPPSGTRNIHKMEDIIVKMLDLENEIKGDIDALVTLKRDINAAIKSVPNPDHVVLLELRYLCFKPWAEIANTMNYGRKYIFRLHENALRQVAVPRQEDTKVT